jgi:hypothetical protein
MSTDVQRSSIEKRGSTDIQLEKVAHAGDTDALDFGGDTALPPPPNLTAEEERQLYRKVDLRCVVRLYKSK